MTEYISNNYEDTIDIAKKFAKQLHPKTVIAFMGDLGAGKTSFSSGILKGLGSESLVSSPTFALCNIYTTDLCKVYHYDMYRINSWDDLYSTGFFDYIEDDVITLIEWSENVFNALPDTTIVIFIKKIDNNKRSIKIMSKQEAIDDIIN